jgi:hypothetical protein
MAIAGTSEPLKNIESLYRDMGASLKGFGATNYQKESAQYSIHE